MKLDSKIHSIFPNTEPLAYYDTFSQFIKLNNIDSYAFIELLNDTVNFKKNSNAEVFFHEFQHWYDHQSTLWGIQNQVSILNAYNIRLQSEYISEYPRIPKLLNEIEKQSLLNYFMENFNDIIPNSHDDRWKMRVTAGYRFNHQGEIDKTKPINFVRFSSSDNQQICRTPISIASLLESNAKAMEIEVNLRHIMKLDEVERLNEINNLDLRYFEWLYNPHMTLYSVAAHLVSNILGEGFTIFAFELSKIISTIALNIPSQLFSTIKIPSSFEEFGDKNKYFIKEGDVGYIFHCLLRNYSETYKMEKEFNIESLLKCSGLPNLEDLEKLIFDEIEKLHGEIIDGPFKNIIIDKIETGKMLMKLRGIYDQNDIDFTILKENKIAPLIMFTDSDLEMTREIGEIYTSLNEKSGISQLEYIFITRYAVEKLYEFYNVCGI
jgi:hypothetical protein